MAILPKGRPTAPRAPTSRLAARGAEELASVERSAWNGLLGPGDVPLSHDYLLAWEQAELDGLCSRPVLACEIDSNCLVAACPGYVYNLDLVTTRWPQGSRLVHTLRRLFPRLLFARTYELGSPTPFSNPFLVCDERIRDRAVPELIETALHEGEHTGAEFVLVQNFTSRSGPAADVLHGLGFAGVPIPPTAVVDLPYASFDEYLSAMRAPYRRRARQALKRGGELTAELVSDFAGLADELARLWRAVYDRASEVKREILPPTFFRAVSDVDEASVLLMRRPDGSVASFALLLADAPWLSFLQCGFEAGTGREEGAYFRLLYEIVSVAIEGGFEQVDLGITTLGPKLDVGAVPVPLFAWLKHRNPVLQRIIRSLARGPLRPPALEPRRVFKEAPPSAQELVARRMPAT
jgi:predicted N-acyltransferase